MTEQQEQNPTARRLEDPGKTPSETNRERQQLSGREAEYEMVSIEVDGEQVEVKRYPDPKPQATQKAAGGPVPPEEKPADDSAAARAAQTPPQGGGRAAGGQGGAGAGGTPPAT